MFWEDMNTSVQGILGDQCIFMGGNLYSRVDKNGEEFEQVHNGYGYDTRNDEGKATL